MDLSAQRVTLMTPGLTVDGLTNALQLLEDGQTMRRANAAAVEFIHAHAVARAWGDTKDCAADAMSLDVSRHVWVARTDPKRRTWSTASYVHTLGRHASATISRSPSLSDNRVQPLREPYARR
jgi:hypothetical protein